MSTPRNMPSKSDRALQLSEKGISNPQIAVRLGSSVQSVGALILCGRRRREREIERTGKLADILGANV